MKKKEFIKSFGKHNALDGHEKGWFFSDGKGRKWWCMSFFVLSRFRDWIQLLVFIDHFTWSKLDCLCAWFQARWLCRYIDKNFNILSVHDARSHNATKKQGNAQENKIVVFVHCFKTTHVTMQCVMRAEEWNLLLHNNFDRFDFSSFSFSTLLVLHSQGSVGFVIFLKKESFSYNLWTI